ncbi:GAP family protein [Mycobacterium sp. NPDC006124]|uniref:GAP family protein n=1 Tax=Mycobacterium sp. NPDC006124 TaxID=3156729 RepID=UPI0033B12870
MWTTVILLGLTVSIEPTRLGLIALLLTRPRPIRHLIVFQLTGLTISLTVGFTVLFVFHHSFFGKSNISPAPLQIAFGVVLLLLAAVLASNISLDRFSRQKVPQTGGADDPAAPDAAPRPTSRRAHLLRRVRRFLKGESSALSASIGAATAMPSIDYFVLLAIIIASKAPALEQALALLTFLLLAGAGASIPLLSFIVAPAKTRIWVQNLSTWIRRRTRKQAGMFVGVVGALLIAIGVSSL